MATYLELFNLSQDPDLQKRTQVAVMVAAETIRAEAPSTPNHAAREQWAARALAFPIQEGQRMLGAALAANKDLTVAQITGATDSQLQAKVDAAVDLVAVGSQ